MMKIQKIYTSLVTILAVVLVISVVNSFSQNNEEAPKEKPKEIEIPVKKDAKKNGYKLSLDKNLLYFQIVNVVEPKALEVVNGKVKLNFQCKKHKKTDKKTDKKDDSTNVTDIVLKSGGTEKILSPCTNQLEPFLQLNYIISLQGLFPSRN